MGNRIPVERLTKLGALYYPKSQQLPVNLQQKYENYWRVALCPVPTRNQILHWLRSQEQGDKAD